MEDSETEPVGVIIDGGEIVDIQHQLRQGVAPRGGGALCPHILRDPCKKPPTPSETQKIQSGMV